MAKTDTPKAVLDTIATLRAERGPLAARLDAIDIALDNLCRVFDVRYTPLDRRKTERRTPKLRIASTDTPAPERYDALLKVIDGKGDMGITIAELRKQTPKLDGKARSNALQILKASGKIRRIRNTWVKAA